MPQLSLHSPFGEVTISEEDGAIVALDWGWGRDQTRTPLLLRAVAQLHGYFDGHLRRFELPLRPTGSAYRQRVWAGVGDIPFGATASYAAVAAVIGGGARAVGAAMAANPLPILIPCHRVVASAGLGGYSGGEGVATKRHLLDLEHSCIARDMLAQSALDRH